MISEFEIFNLEISEYINYQFERKKYKQSASGWFRFECPFCYKLGKRYYQMKLYVSPDFNYYNCFKCGINGFLKINIEIFKPIKIQYQNFNDKINEMKRSQEKIIKSFDFLILEDDIFSDNYYENFLSDKAKEYFEKRAIEISKILNKANEYEFQFGFIFEKSKFKKIMKEPLGYFIKDLYFLYFIRFFDERVYNFIFYPFPISILKSAIFIFIIEGIPDLLSLLSIDLKGVSIGGKTKIKNFIDFFNNFIKDKEKIFFIALDKDAKIEKEKLHLYFKMNNIKSFILNFKNEKDLSEFLYLNKNKEDIIKRICQILF
ncbi:MAG: hypothetical protein ABIL45_03700 [candidate division WOR-3 bacterium]